MNLKNPGNPPSAATPDSSKLVSLLALAAGAIALPQTGSAGVIFTDTTGSLVGGGYGLSFVTQNLPGVAQLGFGYHHRGTTSTSSIRWVTGGQAAGYVRLKTNALFLVHVAAGLTWDQVAGVQTFYGTAGIATYSAHNPNGYDHQYISFKFQDSTQGNAVRYGWLEYSLANSNLRFSGDGPVVSIYGYAYDTTGAKLPTGSVPEPTPAALLALGALAFGAKGVRAWRRERPAVSKA
jgi:hypothetical protein